MLNWIIETFNNTIHWIINVVAEYSTVCYFFVKVKKQHVTQYNARLMNYFVVVDTPTVSVMYDFNPWWLISDMMNCMVKS